MEGVPLWKVAVYVGIFIGVCIFAETYLPTEANVKKGYYVIAPSAPINPNIRIVWNLFYDRECKCTVHKPDEEFMQFIANYIERRDKLKVERVRYIYGIILPQKRVIKHAVIYLQE